MLRKTGWRVANKYVCVVQGRVCYSYSLQYVSKNEIVYNLT